ILSLGISGLEILWSSTSAMAREATVAPDLPATTAIEILEFRVPVELQAEFIERDERVWGKALNAQSGFLYRQVWFVPNAPDRIKIAIYWASREQWKAFPSDLQTDLDRQMQPFDQALVNVEEYWLRPPAQAEASESAGAG
ncbi:MAG: TIGR03792 family protein, partial [Cyanobacteria bacterium J06648_11]